jgi:RND family efflux transporter MFP subunit
MVFRIHSLWSNESSGRLDARLALWLAVLLSGCSHSELDSLEEAATQPTAKIAAELLRIKPQTWPAIVRTQGSLIADEVTTVGAKVAGRVVTVHVDLGDEVQEGAPLVTLDRTEFELQVLQAEAQLSQVRAAVGLKPGEAPEKMNPEDAPPSREAKAVWDEARTQRERLAELRKRNAASEVEFEQAAAAERVAEARYASALNGVREKLAQISVRSAELALARQNLAEAVTAAPFKAKVQSRLVAPGTYVQVGQLLVALVRTGVLRFQGAIPERYAQQLAVGQQVILQIESIPEPYRVEITRISPALNEASRSLLFEASIDNPDGKLRPGLFAEAELVLDPEATALVVPPSAVVEFAGTEKVWKVVDGMAVEQTVQVGRRTDTGLEVTKGLVVGDIILRDGKHGRVAPVEPAVPEGTAEAEPEFQSGKNDDASAQHRSSKSTPELDSRLVLFRPASGGVFGGGVDDQNRIRPLGNS